MPVMMPQKKANQDGAMMSMVGKMAGSSMGSSMSDSPQAGAIGGQIGEAVGGMANNQQKAPSGVGQGDAMKRRMEKTDNLASLENANKALSQLPPAQQNQYAPPLQKALEMERRNRGIA